MDRGFGWALVGFGFLLSACGGGGRPTGPSGSISATAASSFASGQQDTIQNSANAFDADNMKGNFVTTSTSRRNALRTAFGRSDFDGDVGGCTPTQTPTSPTDADSDGVPLTASYAFNNCSGGFGTLSGSFSVTDKDDAVPLPLGGFRFEISNFGFTVASARDSRASVELKTNGFFDVTVASPSVTSALEMSYDITANGNSASLRYFFDSTLTPDNFASPNTSGAVAFSGFFQVDGGSAEYTLQFSSEGLTYGGCTGDKFIKSGTLTMVDGVPNTIKATFTNCNVAWTYNDTALDLSR